jgi:hypothetical protein
MSRSYTSSPPSASAAYSGTAFYYQSYSILQTSVSNKDLTAGGDASRFPLVQCIMEWVSYGTQGERFSTALILLRYESITALLQNVVL